MTLTPTRASPRAFDRQHRAITVGLLALVTMFAFEAVAVSLAMPSVAREPRRRDAVSDRRHRHADRCDRRDGRGRDLERRSRRESSPRRGRSRLRGGPAGLRARRDDGGLRRGPVAAGPGVRRRPDRDVRRRRRRLPRPPAHAGVLAVRHRLGGAVDRRAVHRRRPRRPAGVAVGVPGGRRLRRGQHDRRAGTDGSAPGRPRRSDRLGPPAALRRGRRRSGSSPCTRPGTGPALRSGACSCVAAWWWSRRHRPVAPSWHHPGERVGSRQ